MNVVDLTLSDEQSFISESVRNLLARFASLPDELSYLTLPEDLKIPAPLDLVISVVAQNVLRNFAWRLPGFAESRFLYLSNNFLDFSASIEDDGPRRIARLGSPPLRLILSINGMLKQTYQLSWLDDRPIAIFEES